MKKIIAALMALTLITAAPASAVYAAEQTAPAASAASDTAAGITMKDIAGKWRYDTADGDYAIDVCTRYKGIVEVSEDGSYTFDDESGVKTKGTVTLGTEAYKNGTNAAVVSFSGGFSGYYKNDLITIGNGGREQLVRSTYGSAEMDALIEERLNDLTSILNILSGGHLISTDQPLLEGDLPSDTSISFEGFGTLADLRALINKTTSGDLRTQLTRECDDIIQEKDGILYTRFTGRSYINFMPEKGLLFSDRTENSFKAVTAAFDLAYGHARAEFTKEDGSWYISGYDSGIFSSNTSIDDRIFSARNQADSLKFILSELAKGADLSEKDKIMVDGMEYAKSKDQYLTAERLDEMIEKTCTGDLRDRLKKMSHEHLIVKDGVVYRSTASKGAPDLGSNFRIQNAAPDSFRAITVESSDLTGYTILDFKADDEWRISGYYLADSPDVVLFTGCVSLDDGELNLREKATTASVILTTIPNGTRLDIYPCVTDGWYKVTYNGLTGYVSSKYIKEAPQSAGDLTNDGIVDSSDASEVLAVYARVSTGGSADDNTKTVADINKDGLVDSSDASLILEYYAYVSTGGTDPSDRFFAKK